MWRGGLGAAYLLPALSSAGASIASPYFRFHIPLIEPDGPVSGIRLSEKVSRGRPRETARPLGKADETEHVVQRCLRKPFVRRPHLLVLGTQPLTQPLASVSLYRSVSVADWPKAEVVGPPDQHAVELPYHHLLVPQSLIPSGHFANSRADADHPLLRGNRTDVRAPCLRRIASTKRIPFMPISA